MNETRYAKQPRTNELLCVSPDEHWPISAVHDRGRRIEVTDRIGRHWNLSRAEKGVWLVKQHSQIGESK